jgi:hypothetical protein
MKRIIIAFILFIFAFKAQSQIALDSLLVEYYNLATTSKDSNLYKNKFFEIFPDNFQLFNSIYGYKDIYSDSAYLAPLYDVSIEHIELFFTLSNTINKSNFIKKVINISLDGYWNADAVNYFQDEMQDFFLPNTEQFLKLLKSYTADEVEESFLNNVDQFLKVLESYTDIEIKSFWHFFFDGIIFDNDYNIRMYGRVYRRINELNYTRILTLLREQFQYDLHEYIISPWAKEIENQ